MDRLTERFADGTAYTTKYFRTHNGVITTHKGEVVDKLADYEDAEEQGLLLRLPCKVGDTVYIIQSNGQIKENEADMMFLGVMWDEYGKEWFTTKEEAESALAEKGGAE